jgi:hypothetical protein
MRSLSVLGLALGLGLSFSVSSGTARAQEDLASVATIHLADGTTVALVEWKLTYEFATWRQKEPVSSAKPQVREHSMLVIGKKSYPVKADTLSLTHVEDGDTVRVVSLSLKKSGLIRMEQPSREIIAPDIDKSLLYQPRSLDLSGKTLSGIERSFCVASFSALVDCGGTETTRVVKVDFN